MGAMLSDVSRRKEMSDSIKIYPQIDRALANKLTALAKKEKRNLTQQVAYILEDWLKQHGEVKDE